MSICLSCGISVPKGQKFCSMCYGDIDYGSDGLYRKMLEEDLRKQQEKQQFEKAINKYRGD